MARPSKKRKRELKKQPSYWIKCQECEYKHDPKEYPTGPCIQCGYLVAEYA